MSFELPFNLTALMNRIVEANESERIKLCSDVAELYEIELSRNNKQSKKEQGQYYTPRDVADVMANWFLKLPGSNVCDVCCGTGILILTYLFKLGYEKSRELIKSGCLYLYDVDEVALLICKQLIGSSFGYDVLNKIILLNYIIYKIIFFIKILDKEIEQELKEFKDN